METKHIAFPWNCISLELEHGDKAHCNTEAHCIFHSYETKHIAFTFFMTNSGTRRTFTAKMTPITMLILLMTIEFLLHIALCATTKSFNSFNSFETSSASTFLAASTSMPSSMRFGFHKKNWQFELPCTEMDRIRTLDQKIPNNLTSENHKTHRKISKIHHSLGHRAYRATIRACVELPHQVFACPGH